MRPAGQRRGNCACADVVGQRQAAPRPAAARGMSRTQRRCPAPYETSRCGRCHASLWETQDHLISRQRAQLLGLRKLLQRAWTADVCWRGLQALRMCYMTLNRYYIATAAAVSRCLNSCTLWPTALRHSEGSSWPIVAQQVFPVGTGLPAGPPALPPVWLRRSRGSPAGLKMGEIYSAFVLFGTMLAPHLRLSVACAHPRRSLRRCLSVLPQALRGRNPARFPRMVLLQNSLSLSDFSSSSLKTGKHTCTIDKPCPS